MVQRAALHHRTGAAARRPSASVQCCSEAILSVQRNSFAALVHRRMQRALFAALPRTKANAAQPKGRLPKAGLLCLGSLDAHWASSSELQPAPRASPTARLRACLWPAGKGALPKVWPPLQSITGERTAEQQEWK